MRTLALVVASCLVPHLASAQSSALRVPSSVQAVLDAFEKPLHPILTTVPGGSVAVGVGYDTPRIETWFNNASAVVTRSRCWAIEAEAGYQTAGSHLGVFGKIRHMNELEFFGIGPDSALENRSNYRLRETSGGVRGWFHPIAKVRVGGLAEAYLPDLGFGSDAPRSIEQVFQAADVPGFDAERAFSRYRGFVELAGQGAYQGTYQLAIEAVHDHEDGEYSFRRVEVEAQQRFPGLKASQRLTLHGLFGLTNHDAVVPYYLQYTLGGTSLNAFRPDTLGTDGTKATLRGYQNYRFRDRNILLLQAEYRVPLRKNVDATVFYDAGQVAGRTAGVFRDLKQGTGFSLSYMRKGTALIRMDTGYGSGEGVHVFWGFGGVGF